MKIINESFLKVISDKTSKFTKIHKSKFLTEGEFPIVDQGQEYIAGYTNNKEDINYLGEPVIIFGDHTRTLKYIDFPFAIGADGVKVLHVNKDKLNPLFAYYYLKSLDIPSAGYSRHFKFIKNKKLNFPESVKDQKRIAQVLSNCGILIQKRKETIALLDELLKSTFLEMFAKRAGEEVSLGEEIDIQNGLVNPNELPYSEMFHVGGRNIESNTGKISNLIKAKDENLISGKYLFEEGYLLYSKIRPNLNKVVVMDFIGICSADIYPIKPKKTNRLNLHFLRYELMSQKFVTYAVNNSGRANIPKINRKTLNAYKLKLPSIEKQNMFAEIVKKTEVIRNHFYTHLQELENLYGSISQKAFKGELDLGKVVLLEDETRFPKRKEFFSQTVGSNTPSSFLLSEEIIDKTKKEESTEIEKPRNRTRKRASRGRRKTNKGYLKQRKKKYDLEIDITNLSLSDFLGIPLDVQAERENIDFDFIEDDLFYQFLLKDTFNKEEKFTSVDVYNKLNNYFYSIGNVDYNHETWKSILFKFLEAKPPLLEQLFDDTDNTVKLKLTDEAFKA